jgi:hypothetical protein
MNLPDELSISVFQYFDKKTILSLRLVCREFKRIASCDDIWKDIFELTWGAEEFCLYNGPQFDETDLKKTKEALQEAKGKLEKWRSECPDKVLALGLQTFSVAQSDNKGQSMAAKKMNHWKLIEKGYYGGVRKNFFDHYVEYAENEEDRIYARKTKQELHGFHHR